LLILPLVGFSLVKAAQSGVVGLNILVLILAFIGVGILTSIITLPPDE
jgi:hypothetical protein